MEGNTGIANVIGGGEYKYGEEITVSAPEVEYYIFSGWYDGDELVSYEPDYTFEVTADIDLIAKYESEFAKGTLHIIGSNYKVDESEEQLQSADFQKAIGSRVQLSYVGDGFLYWTNVSNNIVSTSPDYSFVMVGNMTIKLVTTRGEEDCVTVVVLNAYNQVISQGTYAEEYEIEDELATLSPTKMGHEFVKWVFKGTKDEATPEAIIALAGTDTPYCEVVPYYALSADAGSDYLTIQVKKGEELLDNEDYMGVAYPSGKKKNVSVTNIKEWFALTDEDQFCYWTLDGETPASDEDMISIIGANGAEFVLTAVFNEDNYDVEPYVTISQQFAFVKDGLYRIGMTMFYFVPDEYEVLEAGFVYSLDSYYEDEPFDLVIGADNSKVHLMKQTSGSAFYTCNMNMRNDGDKTIFMRAFVTYMVNGDIVTIYSDDMRYGSFNDLNQ